jgi:predicted ester cyclase
MNDYENSTHIKAANGAILVEGNLDAVSDFFTPDYVVHVTGEDLLLGHNGLQMVLALYRKAFPDIQVEVEILAGEKDRIAWQKTLRGTHLAAFKGFPATGRPMIWREMVTSHFRDGFIAEE